jgi:hypothetical protein
MKVYTELIKQSGSKKTRAQSLWKDTTARRHVHSALSATLAEMASGHERCMYCGDNQGTDIDHFEPLSQAPIRTFEWTNHLLACSLCNSHHKRDLFPRDENGSPLLIDPTIQEPLDHLHLVLGTGEYKGLTPQGEASIKVFGLGRGPLVKGRRNAYRVAAMFFDQWRTATDSDQHTKAHDIVRTAWEQPLADVLASMFHQSVLPVAESLFQGESQLLGHLRDPELRVGFLDQI